MTEIDWTNRKNNFLLRSKYQAQLLQVLVAAEAGQVAKSRAYTNEMYELTNANGAWRNYCTGYVRLLVRQGYMLVTRRADRANMWDVRATEAGLNAMNALKPNKTQILSDTDDFMRCM
jgi:hypothetical protein